MSHTHKSAALPAPTQNYQALIEAIYHAVETERREWAAVKRGRRGQSQLFGFARELRKCSTFDSLDDKTALTLVCNQLKQAGSALDTEFSDCDDAAVSFVCAWRASDQCGLFERAVRAADAEPELIQHPLSPRYTRFIRICKHLQLAKGAEPFILDGRTFAQTLGVSKPMMTKYRRQAESDGLLRLVTPGNYLEHRSARCIYTGPR
jgi:hypothetical protein